MSETLSVTLHQMLQFLLLLAAGFCVRRLKKDSAHIAGALSQIEVAVFLPALCFSSVSEHCSPASLAADSAWLLAGTAVLAAGLVAALPLSRLFGRSAPERDVYLYSFTVPNLAYLGYPLVSALWGSEALYHFVMFTFPFNVFIYTVGVNLFRPRASRSLKLLINPVMIALVAGAAVGLTGLRLPSFLTDAAGTAGGCLGPVAMLLTGCVLGGLKLDRAFFLSRAWPACLIRLLGLPALGIAVLMLAGVDAPVARMTAVFLALPFGLNSVIFPEAFGGDSASGAKLCFFSHMLCIVTLPAVAALAALAFP